MSRFRVLTPRGLVLILVGVVTLIVGYWLGQREFVVLGTLALALPLLGLLTVARAPRSVTHRRFVHPSRAVAGSDIRVQVEIANTSPALPVGGLLAADTVPAVLGQEPRFTVGFLAPRGMRQLNYRVRTQLRGHFWIGPLRLWFTDPFGCVRLPRTFGAPAPLLVTPPVVALSVGFLAGHPAAVTEGATHLATEGEENDVIPREYRHGDDVRRVHWRSTARHGRLMVRREERQWRDRSEILVDTRAAAHAGVGPDASLEVAVSAAASIALHLIERSQDVRVSTTAGEAVRGRAEEVLDFLALVEPAPASVAVDSLAGWDQVLPTSIPSGRGLLVAVLGGLDDADTMMLARMRGAAGGAQVAVLCGRAAWPSPETLTRSTDTLVNAGWTVLRVDSPHDLAWPRLLNRPVSHGEFS